MTDRTSLPTPDEARRLLSDADSTGRQATAAASWPAVAVLLAFGSTLSLGTLALGLTEGRNYLVAMVGLLVWIGVVVAFQLAFMRSHKVGFGKRWVGYIVGLFGVYVVSMVIVAGSQGERVVATCLLAGTLLVVSVGCALFEAREARR
jgi:hypothetical protein